MLRLLQSIFGFEGSKDAYPESVITNAIERAVDGTDPWLRSVSGYQKRLKPSVVNAVDHVVSLVNSLSPAVPVSPARYADDRLLKAFFISQAEMRNFLRNDWSLREFLRRSTACSDRITALLFMEKKESRAYGAEMSGDMVMRDVPQVTLCFESHRLMDPAWDEEETLKRLKKRAFDYLVRNALQRIAAAKGEMKELERQSTLLQSKLDMLRRGGWGFDGSIPAPGEDLGVLEERLGQVEAQLLELGNGGMLESYLDMVIDVLERPGEFLRGGRETVILDSLRIKRERADVNCVELALYTLVDADGRSFAVQLISLPTAEVKALSCP